MSSAAASTVPVEDDFIVDDEGAAASDTMSEEEDDDNDGDVVVCGTDDDCFDIEAFKTGNSFDEQAALRAFDVWKQRRNAARAPPSWQTMQLADDPIGDDEFTAKAKELNKNANARDRERICEIDMAIAAGASPAEAKRLSEWRERCVQAIARRPE